MTPSRISCWWPDPRSGFEQYVSYWGKFFVRTLGIPRRTWLSVQVQVHVAFALSALLHCMGDLMVGKEHFGRSWTFFAVNGLAITFEDTVVVLARRVGLAPAGQPPFVMRVLGHIWVLWWCTWSAPLYQRVLWQEMRVAVDPSLPYSPIRSLILPVL